MEKKTKQNLSKFTCEWCEKSFTNAYTLKTHIETAKYCLKERGEKNTKDIECEFCFTKFSVKSSFVRHIDICAKRKQHEKEQMQILHKQEITKFKKKLKERDAYIEKLDKHIEKQKEYIKELELKLAKGEGYIECFKEAKPQQNITNYVNNKIKNVLTTTIPPLTINLVRENVRDNYTYDIFCKGEAGLLTFIEGIIIKKSEEDENLIEQNYACTDTSRNNCHILTQKDPDNWKLDTKANFINKILDELRDPAEQHYQTLMGKIIKGPKKTPYVVEEYVYNSNLSMDENIDAEKIFDSNAQSIQQNREKRAGNDIILENVEPVYYGITSEDKREELFKSVRNKVKNIASI